MKKSKINKLKLNSSLRLWLLLWMTIFIIKIKSNKLTTKAKSSSQLLTNLNSENKFISQIRSFASNKLLLKSQSQTQSRSKSKISNKTKSQNESSLTNKNCYHLCTQCSMNDSSYCTICQPGMIFYSFSCYISCPPGTFLEPETRSCKECHEECPICWGPERNMCGNSFGQKAQVVNLEDEIIYYFSSHIFIKDEVDQWLNSLQIVFKNQQQEDIYPLFAERNPSFSVYIDENSYAELPIGSFSWGEGMFIPVVPYLNRDKKLIESHWVFRKGMWNGKNWQDQLTPRLPSFIALKGSRDKIYKEKNGYWVYDVSRHWIYISSKNIEQEALSVAEKIQKLNQVKIDVKIKNSISAFK